MKIIALFLPFLLCGCAIHPFASLKADLASLKPPAAPNAPSVAIVCPASATAGIESRPAWLPTASMPQALTEKAGQAENDLLTFTQQVASWGQRGWDRAKETKDFCQSKNAAQ